MWVSARLWAQEGRGAAAGNSPLGFRPNTVSSRGRAFSARLVWILAWGVLECELKARMPATADRGAMGERPWWAERTAMALLMMGHRLASSCRFDMDPPQWEETCWAWGRAVVERALRVAGDDFFRNGHTALDCRRTESMAALGLFFNRTLVMEDSGSAFCRLQDGSMDRASVRGRCLGWKKRESAGKS